MAMAALLLYNTKVTPTKDVNLRYGIGFTKSASPELAATVKVRVDCCRTVDHSGATEWPTFT